MVTTAKMPAAEDIIDLNQLSESEERNIQKTINRGLKRRKKNPMAVSPADSFMELRGVLEGVTDEEGREGTEMLRAARKNDKRKNDELIRRHTSDSDE